MPTDAALKTAIPPALQGLTTAEVTERTGQGKTNHASTPPSRSTPSIVRANVLNRFNAIFGALLAVIVALGSYPYAILGLLLVANTGAGILQELKAKRTLDRLLALDAPTVTVIREGRQQLIDPGDVVAGDVIELEPGAQAVADGELLAADALEVDESLLTGGSLPQAKHRGTDVHAGTFVTAGRGWYRADRVGVDAYASGLATRASLTPAARSYLRRETDRILGWITWLFIPVAAVLIAGQIDDGLTPGVLRGAATGLLALIPEGLVLFTSVAFTAGAARLARKQVLVQELPAVEGLARVDVLCIDKTGTLTEPVLDVVDLDLVADGEGAPDESARQVLGALAWSDPDPNATMSALAVAFPPPGWRRTWRLAFSSVRGFSGAGFDGHGDWVIGSPDVLLRLTPDTEIAARAAGIVDQRATAGQRVLLLARLAAPPPQEPEPDSAPEVTPVAIVSLQERVRPDAADTLARFQEQGITLKVISGDDPRTVAAVASRLGIAGADNPVDGRTFPSQDPERASTVADSTVFGRMRPEQKQAMVSTLQDQGHTVAMAGDGINDILALEQADIGMAMGSGSPASRAVAPVVLLGSPFAAMPAVLAEGRRAIANVELIAKLFLTKTVYAALLALAIGAAGMTFPFLPGHLLIIGALAMGLPGLLLALAPHEGNEVRGFVRPVLRFALPTGAVAVAATFAAYALASDPGGVDRSEARTVAAMTLFLVVLWVLAILGRSGTRSGITLIAAPAAAFTFVLAIPGVRDLFAFQLDSILMVLSAVGVAAIARVALELGWQVSGWVGHRPAADPTPTPDSDYS